MANSYLSTTLNPQTGNPEFDPVFGVPKPDDYYSGLRPKIHVVEASGFYTPYVAWHHWANEGNTSASPNAAAPYQVRYAYVYAGDLGTALWEDPQTLTAMGSEGSFAAPFFALTPGVRRPYDLHVIMNVQLAAIDPKWDVAYANLDQFHWFYHPAIFRVY
jgi:hypothetical protein